MKIINDKDIRRLRLKKEISNEDAAKIRSAKVKQKPVPEDKQVKALEKIADTITLSLQGKDNTAQLLLEMIRKIDGIGNIKMPDFPAPIKKLTVVRNSEGFIKEIIPVR